MVIGIHLTGTADGVGCISVMGILASTAASVEAHTVMWSFTAITRSQSAKVVPMR